ncbi:peptidylprolyl isomerase [Deinococcus maricopensis]|uniref:Peptidyl-prolyl cis-trans isomerase n=1 Tax=Deinococcus maricopensis (strain DSM 21211 / LMG 22137 / NRRL B-23946 / LB-34) TaxID=709986 RepID=E8U4G0_DEIML|nr:peptidylprolyl isomerase [Deinococcus maricopensis]ADV68825.1 peptidyl-prolyl cis-trans isomerase cyclophilin type [Deinococcus maricopensis DSM 21211]
MKNAALLALLTLALVACKPQGQNAQSTDTKDSTTSTTAQADTKTDSSAQDSGSEKPAAASSTAQTAKPAALPAGYTEVPALSATPKRTFKVEPAFSLADGKDYFAVIDTNRGQIVVDLLENDTPTTVNNFVFLARNHFYDGTRFHRVIEGFMAQGGDPNSVDEGKKDTWGQGGPGYSIPLEVRQNLNFDDAGVLGMARSADPNSGGSQFYLTLAPASFLNGQYTVFGKVTQGLEVLKSLTKTASSGQGGETPIEGAVPDKVLTVRIVTKA